MHLDRREFIRQSAAAIAAGTITGIVSNAAKAEPPDSLPIVDTHVHVWDLNRYRLPWLDHAGPVLNRTYTVEDYQKAIEGLNVRRAVYVEVSVTLGK